MTRVRLRRTVIAVLMATMTTFGATQIPAANALVSSNPTDATPNFNDTVYTVTRSGSTVYVGGSFTRVTDRNGTYVRRGAAAFDRDTGLVLRWNPNVSGQVHDIVVSRGTAYLGGTFTTVDGAARRNLANVQASRSGSVRGMARAVSGPVFALTLNKRRLFVGGHFSRVAGKPRVNLAAVRRRSPYRVTGWRPKASDGEVRALRKTRGGVVVGGFFNQLNGQGSYKKLAMVNQRGGALVRRFDPAVTMPIFDVTSDRGKVYAAAGGSGGGFVAAYARRSGGQRWLRQYDGDVAALALSKGLLYTGGHFTTVCNTTRTVTSTGDCIDGGTRRMKLAALERDGSLQGWNPGADSAEGVWAMSAARRGDWLAIGGAFTRVNGETHHRLAILS